MRMLVILLLLVVSYAAHGATATVTVERCWEPDGPYAEAAKCPGRLSDVTVPTRTTSGATINHTTTSTSGTTHYYIKENTTGAVCTTLAPTRKQQTTGSGAVAYSTGSISGAGAQTKALTGLSPDTNYCAFVLDVKSYRGSNRLTKDFRTLPSTPDPDDMDLAGYFVGSGGCTVAGATQNVDGIPVTCNGTAHGRRFANLSLVPSSASAGTDIWILVGTTITLSTNLITNWGGTSTDPTSPGRAYIASYYLDGSTPRATWEGSNPGEVDTDPTTAFTETRAGTHVLPIIQGGLTEACLKAYNCNWNPINSGVAGPKNECKSLSGDAMLTLNKSNVTVRGLHFRYGSCRAIQFAGTNPNTFSGIRLHGNIIHHFGMQLLVSQNGQFNVAKNNIFAGSAQCFWSKQKSGTQEPNWGGESNCAVVAGDGHSGGATVKDSVPREAYFGFVGNTFLRSVSEGLQCGKSRLVWFKGNKVGNVVYTPNYFDGCQNAVSESNIFWGTRRESGDLNGALYFDGFGDASPTTNVERKVSAGAPPSIYNIFRNNLVAGFTTGYRINKQTCYNSATGEFIKGCNTAVNPIGTSGYHNTFVGEHPKGFVQFSGPQSGVDAVAWAAAWREGDWRNNIFGGSQVNQGTCYADAQATYDYNLWSEVPAASCRGSNDIGGSGVARNPYFTTRNVWTTSDAGAPGTIDTTNVAWWHATTWSTPPPADYVRVTVSTNTGADLNGTGTCAMTITDAELANWATIAHEMDYPYSLDANDDGTVTAAEMANWRACAYYDFWGNPRGDTPDVGLHENGGAL